MLLTEGIPAKFSFVIGFASWISNVSVKFHCRMVVCGPQMADQSGTPEDSAHVWSFQMELYKTQKSGA
jgi:hypothetical protein